MIEIYSPTMEFKDESEDFEAFLEADFKATKFANDLLLATNAIDNELDLTTPSKRMNFDLVEVERRMNRIASENYETLLKEANKMNDMRKVLQVIKPPISHVQNSFKRLELEIIKPYEEAQSLNDALKKLHTTSILLRGVTYFIHLIKEIEEASIDDFKFEPKNLVKAAKTHKQLSQHLKESSNLLSLKIVRDFDAIGKEKCQLLVQSCESNFKKIHIIDDDTFLSTCIALALLSPGTLSKSIKNCLETQISYSLNQLNRVLTSPRNFGNTMIDVSMKGKLIFKLQRILNETEWPDDSEQSNRFNERRETALDVALKEFDCKSLISVFWKDLATRFEPKFRETINRGGPVAKSLRVYSESIETSIIKGVLESCDDLEKDGMEVKLMLNSIKSLSNNVRRS